MGWTSPVTDSKIVAIHAALLPTEPDGVVVYYGDWAAGTGNIGVQEVTHTWLHRLQAGLAEPIEELPPDALPDTDVFCAGQAFLADGRLLAAGGTFGWEQAHEGIHQPHYDGERACWIYLPRAKRWTRVADLNFQPGSNSIGGGRWYPTLVALENGDVFVVGGHPAADDYYPTNVPDADKRHNNNTPERYSPGADTWTLMTADITAPNGLSYATDGYPRYHLLPDGRLFSDTAGKDSGNGSLSKKRLFDPFAGTWTGPDVGGLGSLAGRYRRGSEATSVLMPLMPPNYSARILACNSDDPTAFRIDVDDSPTWEETAPRTGSAAGRWRANACATLLPTGQVLVTGGWPGNYSADDPSEATREPELYTPGIDWEAGNFSNTAEEEWVTIEEPAPNRRGYHSTALLLPDGRVWHGGSTTKAEPSNKVIDVFEPDYVDQAGRPVISSAPSNIGYSMGFGVDTPQADAIERVALIRCGSITHGFNTDQRYVALNFGVEDGGTLNIVSPPNSRIAPPGYYMLWLIDDQGRPCQRASFIRVSTQKLVVSADISTFSIHEVEALGTPAVFSNALYVVADGFLPSEVTTPTYSLLYTNNEDVPGVSVTFGQPKYEAGSDHADVAQRIIYPVHITFTSTAAFNDIPDDQDFRPMVFHAQMGLFVGFVRLDLSKNPNPRMRDGDPPWLSIDLRVFKTNPGDSPTAGVAHPPAGEGAAGAYSYIQDVISAYNSWAGGNHPFDVLPTDQDVNRLELASEDVNGDPVYNYALARVRFRAPDGVDAADVRVFFRMWTTGWTALEYDLDRSYRRMGNGPSATPLLGIEGGEVNNVPCFAQARTADMETQSDTHNRRTLQGVGATEVYGYFGCWLDVNQVVERFPLEPAHNGPFTDADDPDGLKSIQELMRGLHQCLVAEIHYDLDPTPLGATPGSSDNLAQRNILFDDSDNPGTFAAHLVHHTFELKSSPVSFQQAALAGTQSTAAGATRLHPDELVIDWGELPRDSLVTFFMPQVDSAEIVRTAARRQSPGNLRHVGPGTVMCKVTDVGFMPIPGPLERTIAGLVSVQLPPGVPYGKTYTVVLRQIAGRGYRVLGTTELRIRVAKAEELLPTALHNLSVLRHIAKAIPLSNRWYPVFERYLAELADRVRAFGGDPASAVPSPTGHAAGDDDKRPGHGDGRGAGCFTGKVRRLRYDCFGNFEGFELHDCDCAALFESADRGVERIVLTACEHDLMLTVHHDPVTRRPKRLWLECCPVTRPCGQHDHTDEPAREQRGRQTDPEHGGEEPGHHDHGHHDHG